MKKRRIVEQHRIGPCRRSPHVIRWSFKLECGHHGTRDRAVDDVHHVGRLTSCKSCTGEARHLAMKELEKAARPIADDLGEEVAAGIALLKRLRASKLKTDALLLVALEGGTAADGRWFSGRARDAVAVGHIALGDVHLHASDPGRALSRVHRRGMDLGVFLRTRAAEFDLAELGRACQAALNAQRGTQPRCWVCGAIAVCSGPDREAGGEPTKLCSACCRADHSTGCSPLPATKEGIA